MKPCLLFLWAIAAAAAPILNLPGGAASSLTYTTFATGLNFPFGLVALNDGSLLVGATSPVNHPSFISYYNGAGQILHLQDADHDGIADGAGTVVATLPGALAGLTQAGNLLVATTLGNQGTNINVSHIHLLAPSSGGNYTQTGQIDLAFNSNYSSITVLAAPDPGTPGGSFLYFHLTGGHEGQQGSPVAVTGLINETLAGGSVYRLRLAADGTVTGPSQLILNGLRNTAGMAIDPATGDLYFTDNGFDIGGAPEAADELNKLPATQLGTSVGFYGYQDNYTRHDGTVVGGAGTQPLVAFVDQNGIERAGVSGLALAPAGFPMALRNGFFVGFHGNYFGAGTANRSNPVVFYDLGTQTWFDVILPGQAGLGHIDTFAATTNALFFADFSSTGAFDPGAGIIYRLAADPVPEPGTLWTLTGAGVAVWLFRRRCYPRIE